MVGHLFSLQFYSQRVSARSRYLVNVFRERFPSTNDELMIPSLSHQKNMGVT